MLAPHAFILACPLCHTPWLPPYGNSLVCPVDKLTFTCEDGIWRFLLPERATYLRQFMAEYEQVRLAEGWGSSDPAYYRALPFKDLSGRYPAIWHIRAQSYRALQKQLLGQRPAPQRILDLGAGNGWLAYRLVQAGHEVTAVDLMVNRVDGLGTHPFYGSVYLPLQAEFAHLPLTDGQFDWVIFNGSFHYATSYEETLGEVLRLLRPHGRVLIMDSPLYKDGGSGEKMVQEREALFAAQHGFRGKALPHENFLTYERLAEITAVLPLTWRFIQPYYGWRWMLRPWWARLRGGREPATFQLIVGELGG